MNRRKPQFLREKGRIYFSGTTERKIFFILTLAMLAAGVISQVIGL